MNVVSASEITAVSPAGAAGTVDVTVTGPGGTTTTSTADHFTYQTAPTVTAVGPGAGPLAGGTPVTITGTGFTGATLVDFGTAAASGLTVNAAGTQVTATSPAGTGTVDVTVTTPGGVSAISTADEFTYLAAPTVTGVSPAEGPTDGGTAVTITGTTFTDATKVDFGPNAAANVTVNAAGTQITATSPAGTGQVDVTVTGPGGESTPVAADEFTYMSVTAVSPAEGPTDGGTPVTITGTGFTGATAVEFGTTPATSVDVVSATQITAVSPEGTGTVNVTVTGPGGTTTTSPADEFTYMQVTGISPAGGPFTGGTPVTITGTGFTGATAVDFGTAAATNLDVVSATEITVVSPPGTGTVDVTVTGPGGTTTIVPADEFSYLAAPAVAGISPAEGPTDGGTSVTITGTSFTDATKVDFGPNAASGVTVNANGTQITATSPAGTGTVDVIVTGPGGVSTSVPADEFTYMTVASVSPAEGPTDGGTAVTITGTGFTGATAVHFGANLASGVTVNSNGTQITALSPEGTGTVDVTVTGPGGTTTTAPADQFTYMQVTSLNPVAGPMAGGTPVTITGTGFTGATRVDFGATAASNLDVVSATEITVVSPPGTGTVDVTVTGPGGTTTTSPEDEFTYLPAPEVTGISPAEGPTGGGTAVTILGTGFTDATRVDFGPNAAAHVVIDSATEITATSPAGSGTVDVIVTGPGGVSTSVPADEFTYMTVTGVSPVEGPTSGGSTVTITGTGFTGATAVDFGPNAATNLDVVSATQITATSPAGTGTVHVTVTGPGGTTTTSPADEFTYMQVTGVSPAAGPLAGGTPVTITGTGFTGATLVDFGTTPVSNFTVNSSGTQITLTSPAGTGTVDVTVTGPGGTTVPSPADRVHVPGGPGSDGRQSGRGTDGRRHAGNDYGDELYRRHAGRVRHECGHECGSALGDADRGHEPRGHGHRGRGRDRAWRCFHDRAGRRVHLHDGDGRESGGGPDQRRHAGDDHRQRLHGRDGGRLRPERGHKRGCRLGDRDHGHQPGGHGHGRRDGDRPWRHDDDLNRRPVHLHVGDGRESRDRGFGGRHGGDDHGDGLHGRDAGRLRPRLGHERGRGLGNPRSRPPALRARARWT